MNETVTSKYMDRLVRVSLTKSMVQQCKCCTLIEVLLLHLVLKIIRWVLLLQEFDLHIVDRKGADNPVADNLV